MVLADKPRAGDCVLFDAGLTLIHPVSTVERIYADYAQSSGIPLDELVQQIRYHFKTLFDEERQIMAEGADGYVWSDALDRDMWRRLCFAVAEAVDGLTDDPQTWYEQLYDHFGRPETWALFPETVQTLRGLAERGVRLGVVSNWDSRLAKILDVLELSPLMEVVLISAVDGVRKPGPQIFALALERLGAGPQRVWMVGDSLTDDVQGAKRAGLRGVLVHRGQKPPPPDVEVVGSLDELL